MSSISGVSPSVNLYPTVSAKGSTNQSAGVKESSANDGDADDAGKHISAAASPKVSAPLNNIQSISTTSVNKLA